jgi:extracellular factor (EF) 3-hydroxypalmitic acid methyl ester biosynthesis protein
MNSTTLNIFSRIKIYRKLSQELQILLSKNADDVPKFQEIFNLTVDRVYQDIMEFEIENMEKFETNIYKLKKIFEKRYRRYFIYGDYIKWCLKKPFGYAGDFKIIDDIYQNQPHTSGFDRLWDNWVMQLAVSKAVRERKEDFKKLIFDFVKKNKGRNLRIMNLASGPAREIKELLEEDSAGLLLNIIFDCYDFDLRALDYAKQVLSNSSGKINFFQKNAVRLALKKNIADEIPFKYDLIYSTGLFDYFDERIAVRLVGNLKKLLRPYGIMLISNARDKYSNSSAVWMEWVGEWHLIYRTEEELKKIFLDAGFSPKNIQIVLQHSKVMQYCLARK